MYVDDLLNMKALHSLQAVLSGINHLETGLSQMVTLEHFWQRDSPVPFYFKSQKNFAPSLSSKSSNTTDLLKPGHSNRIAPYVA